MLWVHLYFMYGRMRSKWEDVDPWEGLKLAVHSPFSTKATLRYSLGLPATGFVMPHSPDVQVYD